MFRTSTRILAVVLVSSLMFAGTIGPPYITSISPASVPAGTSSLVMTVSGTNFTQGSVVRWNGVDQRTTFVSPRQLQITVSGTLLSKPGTVTITVYTYGRTRNSIVARSNTVTFAPKA